MSNPVAFSTNGDPFRGGSFTPASGPGAVNGAISGAASGSSLITSVGGSTPMLARNSRGSNITVPYARVVFHPPGNTALPPSKEDFGSSNSRELDLATRLLKTPAAAIMTETEMLYSGRLAFVLGRRGSSYKSSVASAMGLDLLAAFGGQTIRGNQLSLAPGTGGIATAQRLCSFEYLERYFSHVLSSRTIVVGDGAMADLRVLAPNLKGAAANQLKTSNGKSGAKKGTDFSVPIALNPAEIEVGGILEATSEAPISEYAQIQKQGIDADNETPFLHGGSVSRKLHMGKTHEKTNLAVGDEAAFKWLYNALLSNGIIDWTPDGVVMSKLSEGDKMLDDELDSRDGMLFNVAVAGPAISSLWSQEPELEVMPLDRVFIVIIADRWVGNKTAELENLNATDYAKKKNEQLLQAPATAGNAFTLTNFKVKRMTSAQMVAACMATDKGRSKLRLSRGGEVAEYIVGGWSVGSIIDSAASRATQTDASTLVGAVKRTRVNSAHNLVVKVEWWSADQMCRSYGPRQRRARYDGPKQRQPREGPTKKPAASAAATVTQPATEQATEQATQPAQ